MRRNVDIDVVINFGASYAILATGVAASMAQNAALPHRASLLG